MKLILNILGACITIFGQVILVETTDWGINYLNAHPTGFKLLPLSVGLIGSFFFTCTETPLSNATKPIKVDDGKGGSAWNPFWVWLGLCLIITLGINLMLE